MGEDKILYGSDYAIWTPQWLVETGSWSSSCRRTSPSETGVSLSAAGAKKKILGLNAARLYDIDIAAQKRKLGASASSWRRE